METVMDKTKTIEQLDKNARVISETPVGNNGAEIVMEIYRSGKTIDGRVITRQEIREVYKNTTEQILSKGVTIPLKFGHWDQDQTLKGEVVALEMKRRKRKKLNVSELSLIAKVNFTDVAYDLWKAGKLKNVSAEIMPEGVDENGREFGSYLSGLALLGIDPPAIPWLQTDLNEIDIVDIDVFRNDGSVYYSMIVPEKHQFEDKSNMEPEKFQADKLIEIKDAVSDLLAMVEALVGEEEGEPMPEGEGEEGMSTDQQTDDFAKVVEENENLKAQLEELKNSAEAETAFDALQSAGKIKPSDKDQFSSLVKKAGVKFAVEFYSKNETVKTPPLTPLKQDSLKSNKNAEPWRKYYEVEKKRIAAAPRNRGISKDMLEKKAEYAAKYLYQSESGGVANGLN
jgi:hypothetical protein